MYGALVPIGGSIALEHGPGTFVYRLMSRDGEFVYVGMTDNLYQRLGAHATTQWWPRVATVEWELFDSRTAAHRAEEKLIWRHNPVENIMGVHRGWRIVLRENPNWHRPGCPVGAQAEHRRLALGDRV